MKIDVRTLCARRTFLIGQLSFDATLPWRAYRLRGRRILTSSCQLWWSSVTCTLFCAFIHEFLHRWCGLRFTSWTLLSLGHDVYGVDRNQWNNEITNDYCETPRFKESIKRLNRKTINKALPQDSNLNIATPKASPPKASAFIASKPKAELSSADIYIRVMLFIFLFSLLPAMIVQVLSFLF